MNLSHLRNRHTYDNRRPVRGILLDIELDLTVRPLFLPREELILPCRDFNPIHADNLNRRQLLNP